MAWEASQMGLTEDEIVDFSEDDYKVRSFLDRLRAWRGPRVVAQFSTWRRDATDVKIKEVAHVV